MNWSEHLVNFYKDLKPPSLQGGMEWMHPHISPEVADVAGSFYNKFFNDRHPRLILLGINPGRFGAGVTGINFTAPRQLDEVGISHPFKNQSELSAGFIYEMIDAFGGAKAFYANCVLGSVCPLGLTFKGKNINYYDDKEVMEALRPFIVSSMNSLLQLPYRPVAISIGGEKNFKYLQKINHENRWFEKIDKLAHPRFIMQYRRKEKDAYINEYVETIRKYLL